MAGAYAPDRDFINYVDAVENALFCRQSSVLIAGAEPLNKMWLPEIVHYPGLALTLEGA